MRVAREKGKGIKTSLSFCQTRKMETVCKRAAYLKFKTQGWKIKDWEDPWGTAWGRD